MASDFKTVKKVILSLFKPETREKVVRAKHLLFPALGKMAKAYAPFVRKIEVEVENLDMLKYFTKILTIDDGFKRKPDPEAINYLIEEYNLDINNLFYVGDRDLDIESANNANIKSIFYKPENSYGEPTGEETYIVYDLLEIADLL